MNKKFVSVLVLGAGIVLLGAGVQRAGAYNSKTPGEEAEQTAIPAMAYEKADAGLMFWYADADYGDFFEQAARDYYEKSGVKVQPVYKETLDYMGEIYDATIAAEDFPDVYLLAGDLLEEAYLYGLAEEKRDAIAYEGVCDQAIAAATIYDNRFVAYPLSFNSCVFICQNGYFARQPSSLQSIIDYSDENEPPENVEYLLEWDVNDPFFDFPFIANSVSFEKNERQTLQVLYDETLYQKDLEYFSQILQSFSIHADTVSREKVMEDFLAGKTLCAIIDTRSLKDLEGYSYSLMQIPRLNEELWAGTCAMTDMLVVNDFSEKRQAAEDFAAFMMLEESAKLREMTGYYPVKKPKSLTDTDVIAYESYENAVLAPASMDAKGFWVTLEETIRKYF